jgi:hypothetical protein
LFLFYAELLFAIFDLRAEKRNRETIVLVEKGGNSGGFVTPRRQTFDLKPLKALHNQQINSTSSSPVCFPLTIASIAALASTNMRTLTQSQFTILMCRFLSSHYNFDNKRTWPEKEHSQIDVMTKHRGDSWPTNSIEL